MGDFIERGGEEGGCVRGLGDLRMRVVDEVVKKFEEDKGVLVVVWGGSVGRGMRKGRERM